MPLWKWVWMLLVFPFIYPVMMLPLALPLMITKPLRLILVLILTGLLELDLVVALGVLAFLTAWFILADIVAKPMRGETRQDINKWGEITDTTSIAVHGLVFLIAMQVFDWTYIARWLAGFGAGYYVSTVLLSFMTMPTTIKSETGFQSLLDGEPPGGD